jgi:hypothetical protein
MSDQYEVVWPGGSAQSIPVFQGRDARPLSGRRIGFVWNDIFNGNELWDVVREELSVSYDVTFVGNEVFGNFMSPNADDVIDALPEKLRQSGVDSVIVGVGA